MNESQRSQCAEYHTVYSAHRGPVGLLFGHGFLCVCAPPKISGGVCQHSYLLCLCGIVDGRSRIVVRPGVGLGGRVSDSEVVRVVSVMCTRCPTPYSMVYCNKVIDEYYLLVGTVHEKSAMQIKLNVYVYAVSF